MLTDISKSEMEELSYENLYKQYKSGATIAIISDHPETPVNYLLLYAQLAVKYGVSFDDALKMITVNAAEMLGIDESYGKIKPGYKSGVLIFDRHPIDFYSKMINNFYGFNKFKRCVLTVFGKHSQHFFYKLGGFGVNTSVCLAASEIRKRVSVGVIFALINLACGNSVAKHFFYISKGHFYRAYAPLFGVIVRPVLKMMLVSAFMVQPRKGVAVVGALAFIWAFRACIILLHPLKIPSGNISTNRAKSPAPGYLP